MAKQDKNRKQKRWDDEFDMGPKKVVKKVDKKEKKYKGNKIYSGYLTENEDDFE